MSRLYLDTDVFILITGAGLLEESAQAVGFSLADLRRLQPLPYMLRSQRLRSRYPHSVLERAAAWCDKILPIEAAPDANLQQHLNRISGLDVGEALLFAAAAPGPGNVVATGDKRACRALAAETTSKLRRQLRGKVLCFESVLAALLNELTFENLAQSFAQLREVNQTLRLLLPQGERTDEQAFRDGVQSFEREIIATLGDLSWRTLD